MTQKADSTSLCQSIVAILDDNKGQNIVSIDLEGKSSIADYLVIVTGTSQRHLNALANYVQRKAKDIGIKGTTLEGGRDSGWVILDLGDIVLHLFLEETRELYDLESMWDPSLYKRETS